MTDCVQSEELLAQRYYTDSGESDYVSIEELSGILEQQDGEARLSKRYPFLLPSSLWAAKLYSSGQHGRLYQWLEDRAQYRTDLKYVFDEVSFPDHAVAFLQDQVGFGVDFQDAGIRKLSPALAKKLASWLERSFEYDVAILCDKGNNGVFERVLELFSNRMKLAARGEAEPLPEKMPKLVSVHWGKGESESVLASRFNKLREFLPRLASDAETRLVYVKDDLYIYPGFKGPDGYERFVNVMGGKPSLLPFVSSQTEKLPFILRTDSPSMKIGGGS